MGHFGPLSWAIILGFLQVFFAQYATRAHA
jgi:hypothetical protein